MQYPDVGGAFAYTSLNGEQTSVRYVCCLLCIVTIYVSH